LYAITAGTAASKPKAVAKSASAILAERINSLKTKDENAAAGLAQTAASLFPASSILVSLKNELKLKPWDGLSEANAVEEELTYEECVTGHN